MAMKRVLIFTDGGCHPERKDGAYAAVIKLIDDDGNVAIRGGREAVREIVGTEDGTTSQRMEMMAAIAALEALTEPCEVTLVSDSQYLVKGMTEWLSVWVEKNWHGINNTDLWFRLLVAAGEHVVHWNHTKGHQRDGSDWTIGNNRADALVQEARGAK